MKNKQRTSRTRALSATELDARHDGDFPVDLLREIDQEARRIGVTRQAFIKVRLADSLVKHQ
jgi:hypothetical protein